MRLLRGDGGLPMGKALVIKTSCFFLAVFSFKGSFYLVREGLRAFLTIF